MLHFFSRTHAQIELMDGFSRFIAILNLQNFNFVSKVHSRDRNLHLRTKYDRNRIFTADM